MKVIAGVLGAAVLVSHTAMAESVLSADGKVRTFLFRHPAKPIDPGKAAAMRLPTNPNPLPSLVDMTIEAAKVSSPVPGTFVAGGKGDDRQSRVRFAAPAVVSPAVAADASPDGGVGPQEYGTSGQPYTMARTPGATLTPYRQAGRLFFNPPSGDFAILSCTAALIKPGIVVTAAHCIVPYGSTDKNLNFTYFPAWDPKSNYPSSNAVSASVLASWSDGTGRCATRGKVCRDDIGVITLAPQDDGSYAGATTGWFGYSTSNYSYSQGQAEVAQLGYTEQFDSNNIMLRVDSQGSVSSSNSFNMIIGSPLGDGSDGGPWVVNLGAKPNLSNGSYGKAYGHNIVVGVTSWTTGTASSQKQAGASPFLPDNLGALVRDACSATPAAC